MYRLEWILEKGGAFTLLKQRFHMNLNYYRIKINFKNFSWNNSFMIFAISLYLIGVLSTK